MNAQAQDFDPSGNNAAQQEQQAQAIPPSSAAEWMHQMQQQMQQLQEQMQGMMRMQQQQQPPQNTMPAASPQTPEANEDPNDGPARSVSMGEAQEPTPINLQWAVRGLMQENTEIKLALHQQGQGRQGALNALEQGFLDISTRIDAMQTRYIATGGPPDALPPTMTFECALPPQALMCWEEQEIRQRGIEYEKRYYDTMKEFFNRTPNNLTWDGKKDTYDDWARNFGTYCVQAAITREIPIPEIRKIAIAAQRIPLLQNSIWMSKMNEEEKNAAAGKPRRLRSLKDYLEYARTYYGPSESMPDLFTKYHKMVQRGPARDFIIDLDRLRSQLAPQPDAAQHTQRVFTGLKDHVRQACTDKGVDPQTIIDHNTLLKRIIEIDENLYRRAQDRRDRNERRTGRFAAMRKTRHGEETSDEEESSSENIPSEEEPEEDTSSDGSSDGDDGGINAIRSDRSKKDSRRGDTRSGKYRKDRKKESHRRTTSKKPSRDKYKDQNLDDVKCYNCGEKGHYANRCPNPDRHSGKDRR